MKTITSFVFGFYKTLEGIFSAPATSASAELRRLQAKSQGELRALYEKSQAGTIPNGDSEGRALFFPGTALAAPMATLASFFWRGKVFQRKEGALINKVLGFNAVRAKISQGESWCDEKTSTLIDYKGKSLLFGVIRDEIREISKGIYLGRVYVRTPLRPFFVLHFALDFNHSVPTNR